MVSRFGLGLAGLALVCGLPLAAARLAETRELRLSPMEVAALPEVSAGAGTSGIAHIRMRVLAGDPNAAGPYTIALEMPPNARIRAHTHRDERSAVVVRGIWYFGYGDKANDAAFKRLEPGSFYTEPAGTAHFARTGPEGATVYITGWGPSDTHYFE